MKGLRARARRQAAAQLLLGLKLGCFEVEHMKGCRACRIGRPDHPDPRQRLSRGGKIVVAHQQRGEVRGGDV